MATYFELLDAAQNTNLRQRIRVAIVVAAETIRTENSGTTNHANRLIWAKQAFENPESILEKMIWAVLAQNKAVAYATIIAADDSTVQTAVNAAVDIFAIGA